MGRLTKAKTDEIGKLRKEGYTQKETAEKVGVHIRTVRKYDPLRDQEKDGVTSEALNETREALKELVARYLVEERDGGFFLITILGRRVSVILEELTKKAILEFMAEADRPVTVEEIDTYLDEIGDELFDEALDEAKRR